MMVIKRESDSEQRERALQRLELAVLRAVMEGAEVK